MRVVFMGTPSFAVPSLEALLRERDVTLVVTRPDAVRSRGHALEPSPVKRVALEAGVDVLEATRMDAAALARLREASPDVICVAAYGCILPDEVLGVAPLGCVNVHASLLPRWRGAAPIQRAILAGDERVGVSIMRIAHDLDAGAYCAQASLPATGKGADELTEGLAALGATELVAALDKIEDGTAVWVDQDESAVTFAPKVSKQEMRLDPVDDVTCNLRRVLASSDAAPARLMLAGRGLRVTSALAACDLPCEPACFVLRDGRVGLGCADGTLEVRRVKPDGKREMDVTSWAAGLRPSRSDWGRV